MTMLRRQFLRLSIFLAMGLMVIGHPLPGRTMSLFMGGEEPPPTAPPTKLNTAKPQKAPGQPPNTSPAPQAMTGKPSVPTGPAGAPGSKTQPVTPGPAPATPTQAGAGSSVPSTPMAGSPKPVDAQSAASPAQAVPVPTEANTAEGYSYEPKGRRDPFQSLAKMVKIDKGRTELPPLQRVQIGDVKLLGIIWGGYGYYGLIQTPDGKGYTVKEGMLIGTNNGIITSINSNAIIVSEPTVDVTGKKTTRDIEILLRPKEVS